MMYYRKGDNVETELTKKELPFKDCFTTDTDFLWMHVKGGTKVHNVVSYAKNALDNGKYRAIIWSGQGGGVVKTISCAEILKRQYPLYQLTRACYIKLEEHWLPTKDGLEEIVATRQIPSIHIYQSLTAIHESVKGVQKPNTQTEFWTHNSIRVDKNTNLERSRRRKSHSQIKHQQKKSFEDNVYNNTPEKDTNPPVSISKQSNQESTSQRNNNTTAASSL